MATGGRVNYGGLVIAGVGFVLTRFTVTLAIYETPLRFYLAGVVPLVLGLGLAAFGVALAVADVDPRLVRTTARWCVVGLATMGALVGLTLVASAADGMPASVLSQTYLSNFLIGGSIGGTLTGLYAANDRHQRDALRQQTNRLEVLNRLLRHEILNAVMVIRGYAGLHPDGDRNVQAVIEDHADVIVRTVEDVKYLTRTAGSRDPPTDRVDVVACLHESVETVRATHPEAEVDVAVEEAVGDLSVVANERLEQVFTRLLENAVVYTPAEEAGVDVAVRATQHTVRVSVHDEGPGLPESQQALLEMGAIDEFDDPGTGFGLNVVRLLVESYRGTIETDVDEEGTTVTVVLPRAEADTLGLQPSRTSLTGVRPAVPELVVTLGAALLAGVVYGVVAEAQGGSIDFIGVYYGIQHPVVGWFTHEFHSVVFGFAFAGFLSLAPTRYRDHVPAAAAVGGAWGVVLWFVAAGVVSPVWLGLLGLDVSVPSLSVSVLVSHVAWGLVLGVLTALGFRAVRRYRG